MIMTREMRRNLLPEKTTQSDKELKKSSIAKGEGKTSEVFESETEEKTTETFKGRLMILTE